jgi:DNA topoisomerase-1
VRYGKYGPFVQLGTKDDAEKPKFASLRPHQRMDTLTLEDAYELFKLPRTIGKTAQDAPIRVAIGRFGPYIQYGEKKYVSVKDDDPYTIELPRALELIQAKEELDANRIILDFADAGIQVLNGRYGPYITDRVKNAKIPKDREPKSMTLQECKDLIAAAPLRTKGNRFGRGRKQVVASKPATAPAPAKQAAKNQATKTKVVATKEQGADSPLRLKGAGTVRGKVQSPALEKGAAPAKVPAGKAPKALDKSFDKSVAKAGEKPAKHKTAAPTVNGKGASKARKPAAAKVRASKASTKARGQSKIPTKNKSSKAKRAATAAR